MKRKLLFRTVTAMLITFTFSSTFLAQSGWEEVYSGSNMFMRDICFVEGDDGLWQTGWAISSEGDIIKTTDGGDTWIELSQSLSIELAGISFADETTGMIATFDNQILKSTDGGLTWTGTYSGSVKFDKIAMEDANNAVVAGTQKLYTTDGGTTWTSASGGSYYWDLDYASNSTYYGVNLFGSLGESTDGGASWTDIESLGAMCMMVDFLDDTHGMFGGDLGTIKVTHNGGSTWTTNTLGGGQDAINCGGFFDADTIYVAGSLGEIFKSTDGGLNWSTDTTFAAGVFMPRGLVVTGMNEIFVTGANSSSDGLIWRKIVAPLIADFEASETIICVGSSVDFTDLSVGLIDSWSWAFEGGNPATSTDQNPSVMYSTAGIYNVELIVSSGGNSHTELKTDYISVIETPGQADAPSGDDEICTSGTYLYTTTEVTYADGYDWEVDPADAGTLTVTMNEAILATSDTWTGDFTLKVRATNSCGDGAWSDNLTGTMVFGPDLFTLEGEGGYCMGTDGVEMTLSGSQTGINYELYLGGVPTGIIEAGTGSALSFDPVTEAGFYTAVAISSFCSTTMTGQIAVFVLFPPSDPATPTGADTVCNTETTDYESTGSFEADSYEWTLSPAEAGTLTADELTATVEWSTDFSGTASITLVGINACGASDPSDALEVMVEGMPTPEVSGLDLVCDFDVTDYTTTENAGSTYTWEVTGGTITDGQGTYMVSVEWGEPGTGTVSVTEETATGCEGNSEVFEVMIDDCTGIPESSVISELNLYPNPAGNTLNVSFDSKVSSENIISVMNHLGQVVVEYNYNATEGEQSYQIDISRLNTGLYILNIRNHKEGSVRKQFIKR